MKPRTIIGILLIVAGVWKLANIWGVIENDWLWRQPWTAYIAPAALIYLGILVIVNSYRRDPDQWLQRPLPIGEDGKRICCSVHYGGDEYIYRGEPFHGARLDTFCGGIRMDLRHATITEDEEIEIHTVLEEISEMIGQKEHSRITGRVDQLLLCNYRTGSILSTNITLKEAGIVNGDKLLLV